MIWSLNMHSSGRGGATQPTRKSRIGRGFPPPWAKRAAVGR